MNPFMRPVVKLCIAITIAIACISTTATATGQTPLYTRAAVLPHGTVSIELDTTDSPSIGPTITARAGDTALTGVIFRISPQGPARQHTTAHAWFQLPPRQEAVPLSEAEVPGPRTPDRYAAVFTRLPPATRSIRFEKSGAVSLDWLDDPAAEAAAAGVSITPLSRLDPPENSPWASPIKPGWRTNQHLVELLRAPSANPALAWRVLLTLDGFYPTPAARRNIAPIRVGDLTPSPPQHQTTENPLAIAQDIASNQWQRALLRLWLADPELSRNIRSILAGAAAFPGLTSADANTASQIESQIAPVWIADAAAAAELLALTLRDGSTGALEQAAQVWAAQFPMALGWIIDDAGRTARGGSTAGVVSLAQDAALATARGGRSWTTGVGAIPLAPRMGASLALAPPRAATDPRTAARTTPARPVSLEAGSWRARRTVLTDAAEANPPGLAIRGLARDWSMPGFTLAAGDAENTAPSYEPLGAALLHRRRAGDVAGLGPHWSLFLECPLPRAAARGATPPASDHVDIWLGPRSSPRLVLRVTPDGNVERIAGASGPFRSWTSSPREPDRWTADIAIPDWAIEDDGTLILGITRTMQDGTRAAWPRPMLPWQREPGRIRIDLDAWNDLKSPGR